MKFNKQTALDLTLPEGKAELFVWDDDLPSFGVRLRKSAGGHSASWVCQYRVNRHQRRESLGDIRKIVLEDARKIARRQFAKAALGIDPAADRARSRAEAAAARLTLGVVAERYLDAKQAALRPSTYNGAKLHFTVHWKPLHDRPLDAIKRADVAGRLQELVKVHGRISAARARANLSALFAWAMREGLCESNPVVATNNPSEGVKPRERVLADDELRTIWSVCQDEDFSRIIKLLLLTGCRREEIGRLKRSEINFDTGVMIIPGERTKNGRTLELGLPALALDILQSMAQRADKDFFFGRSSGPFSGWAACKLRLDAQIAIKTGKALPPWRLHDLRRTFRTGLGRLGVQPHIAELAVNHAKGGIQAVYDKHRYQREINAALALWADHVAAVIEDRERKVTVLRRA
jgi:integrase